MTNYHLNKIYKNRWKSGNYTVPNSQTPINQNLFARRLGLVKISVKVEKSGKGGANTFSSLFHLERIFGRRGKKEGTYKKVIGVAGNLFVLYLACQPSTEKQGKCKGAKHLSCPCIFFAWKYTLLCQIDIN